jgi:type I restriction enzyme S subunit
MIEKLKPYPAYKDSGVEWLGEMPAHWEISKLRNILTEVVKRNRPDLPLLSVVREKGVILRDITNRNENHNYIPDDLTNYKVVLKGQFVINKMKAWQGSFGVSPHDGIVSPAYFIFDIDGVEGTFFHKAIRSKAYIPFFTQASDGVRIGQWDLSQTRMREIPFFIPPLPEQTAIVRFLDYMDRRIRRYIRAKQRLIKLLEEYKQALIHQAVTGQMDVRTGEPYPAYKDSGVEWLGKVPEHWRQLPGTACYREKKVPNTGMQEQTVLSLSYGQIIVKPLEKLHGLVPSSFETYQIVNPGDIIVRPTDLQNDRNSLRFGLSHHRGIITSAYMCLRTESPMSHEYGYLLLHTYDLKKIFYGLGSGLRQNLDWRDFKYLPCLVPPPDEQTAIVEYLDAQTAKIDAAMAAARREIELLREYRTRLIADVVTGKVDVREVTAQLPEEPPEEGEWMDTEEAVEGEAADDEVAAGSFSEEEVAR